MTLATSLSFLDRHEHHAFGRARLLAHEEEARDRRALAVANAVEVGAAPNPRLAQFFT